MRAGWRDIGLAAAVYLIATSAAVFCWVVAAGGLPANVGTAIAIYAPVFLAAVFVMSAGAEWIEMRRQGGRDERR
jgi:drug/metabolite transporter (DMT)-like permease